MAPPDLLSKISAAFRAAGEELYLVGGSVRDRLLDRDSLDLDFATSALPTRTTGILARLGIGRPYGVGAKFGTIGLVVDTLTIEITTYRSSEQYAAGSRKPEVQFGRTLFEDLTRRDFTINAMALDPSTEDILDPLGGLADLRAGVLRSVGEATCRFEEDPLRMLRGVRFASELELEIEPNTWKAMRECASQLEHISRERVRDEYSRMLIGQHPVHAMTLLRDSGLMEHSAPILVELTTMSDHGPRHPLSLWDHVMRVLDGVPPRLAVRWAALLHDIAKPRTRTYEPSGRPRFFHHEEVGAEIAREVLTELRYPNALVQDVVLLVETHMQLHGYSPDWSDGAVRRLLLRLGALFHDAVALACADGAGHGTTGTSANAPKFEHLKARVSQLEAEGFSKPISPLTGDDLMERYGRPPGPWIRTIKEALEREVVEGTLSPDDIDSAWKLADSLIADEGAWRIAMHT